MQTEHDLYIDETKERVKHYFRWIEFTHSSTKAAGVMLVAAILALIVANSPIYDAFLGFWHAHLTFGFGENVRSMTLAHFINDVLMAIFFLLVGLEIKYEMTVGELTNIRQAILPIMAAAGGVVAPILIFVAFNFGTATASGWGIPTATDIAFALGVLSLLGDRIPSGVRVFLSTLAVADDIIAILILAIFYGQSPSIPWLGAAALVMIALIALNKRHVYALAPYIALGVVLWYCIFSSGIHSTIAGVLLAFAIPSGSHVNLHTFADWSGRKVEQARESFAPETPVIAQGDYLKAVAELSKVAKQVIPPAVRLEKYLYPWVYFLILPLFALTNADVCLVDGTLGNVFASPVLYGVFFGLLVGKPAGILTMTLITVKSGLAGLPSGARVAHMVGAALLGGIGFTMAIFVANLAFVDPVAVTIAKVGILSASLVAGVAGFLLLLFVSRKDAQDDSYKTDNLAETTA